MEWGYEVIDATTQHAWQFTRDETAIGVMCHDKPIIAFNYTSKYWKAICNTQNTHQRDDKGLWSYDG